ncbi:putative non-specific serine/threonine protein kinase [Helianthus annuus]|nr:putative non-specific serine/threonine protein kinase [Helianthus annuus]
MKKLLFSGVVWILCSYFTFSQPPKLHKQEVEVLLKIWEKLGVVGKKEWSLNKDPCSSAEVEWGIVECNCSFESNTTCRITTIQIQSQNFSTALPVEFTKLLKLEYLDLSYNNFTGTIPSEWATMQLTYLLLRGNRLSGSFPTTLTSMTSLTYLNIIGNGFSGHIPEHIANMKNLETLYSIFFTYNIYIYAIDNPTGKNNRSKLYTFLKFCIKKVTKFM